MNDQEEHDEQDVAALLDRDAALWARSVDEQDPAAPADEPAAPGRVTAPTPARTRVTPWLLVAVVVALAAVSISLIARDSRGAASTAIAPRPPTSTPATLTASAPSSTAPSSSEKLSETSRPPLTTSPSVIRQSFPPAYMAHALDWPGEFRCGHPISEFTDRTAALRLTVREGTGVPTRLMGFVENSGAVRVAGYIQTYSWVLDKFGTVIGSDANFDGHTLEGVGVTLNPGGSETVSPRRMNFLQNFRSCPVPGSPAEPRSPDRLPLKGSYDVVLEMVILKSPYVQSEPTWHVLSDPLEVQFPVAGASPTQGPAATASKSSATTPRAFSTPAGPSICHRAPESAVVPLARYGSSPPIPVGSTPAPPPSTAQSDNVMYTVAGPPGRGTLCIRQGGVTVAANAVDAAPVTYLIEVDQGEAHTYAGAFGPGVSRVEIVAASPDSPITDAYVGTRNPSTSSPFSLGSRALGDGWFSFNLPVASPVWDARLVAYDLNGEAVYSVALA